MLISLSEIWSPGIALGLAFLLPLGVFSLLVCHLRTNGRGSKSSRGSSPSTVSRDMQSACAAYCRYLILYLQRYLRNPNLSPEEIDAIRCNIALLEGILRGALSPWGPRKASDPLPACEPNLAKSEHPIPGMDPGPIREIMLRVTLHPFVRLTA
ncbi:MAG: hypothetical protein JW821_04195 [Deltaproteobacteria bacterium]|nr:hypothetical protein [Deltaproteobacteria bacterium]